MSDHEEYQEAVVATEPSPVTPEATGPLAAPSTAEYDSWTPEQKAEYDRTNHGKGPESIEEIPATERKFKGTPEAGLQRIRSAISLLETHSAAKVGGSLISQALYDLEVGYSVLAEHHPTS